jgi:hypothetical protein
VFISNTNHEENQPAHLTLKDASVPGADQPGRVRRPREPLLPGRRVRVREEGRRRPAVLQINAQNCVHCKTCDIKDPTAEHRWGSRPRVAAVRTTQRRDVRQERLAARHVQFGRTREQALAWIAQTDEPNARRIEASAHRAARTVCWNEAQGQFEFFAAPG